MAHEMVSIDGEVRAFHHLEIELCFRAMISVMSSSSNPKDAKVAQTWMDGLQNIAVGLVNVDLSPHYEGQNDRKHLLDVLHSARRVLPSDGSISTTELNAKIGSEIHTSDGYLDAETIDRAFRKMTIFVAGS
ncbi:hypothetical protein [uncultured Litoreibacter sp.]|uniref:hypothetical protein n=1 Tax=uncultured Litoreibacter sp. TaxID=1392394 RepID=UPI002614E0CF|nr:hypothetical protein [uncultured Litoreibacter sp.]